MESVSTGRLKTGCQKINGVDDGNRTHDNRSHNPVLYQLSYTHRKNRVIVQKASMTVNRFQHNDIA